MKNEIGLWWKSFLKITQKTENLMAYVGYSLPHPQWGGCSIHRWWQKWLEFSHKSFFLSSVIVFNFPWPSSADLSPWTEMQPFVASVWSFCGEQLRKLLFSIIILLNGHVVLSISMPQTCFVGRHHSQFINWLTSALTPPSTDVALETKLPVRNPRLSSSLSYMWPLITC